MIVMKFGGTSNTDAAAIRNVIRIVHSHLSSHPVVVISAIARATNELEQIARSAAAGREGESNVLIDRLIARHRAIAGELIASPERRASLESLLTDADRALRRTIQGISIVGELTSRMMDSVCSYGERLSSAIVAAGLEEHDVPSVWVDAKEFMITNEQFGSAAPLMDEVKNRLSLRVVPLLLEGKVPVTQGFIGATLGGAYTTMGRESSDFSASIIGAAMNAELVQIWTDVDGILTADPAIVRNPRIVRALSFEEAIELSSFGAKVLHPKTMLPLLEGGIPLEIRNSRNSNASGTRVEVQKEFPEPSGSLKSVTYQKGLTLFTVKAGRRFDRYLVWDSVFSILGRHGLQSDMSVTSEYSLAFALRGVIDSEGLQHELEEFGVVHVFPNKASISIVGDTLQSSAGFVARLFHALSDMPIALISFGASDLSLTLVVEESRVTEAINLLHADLFD